MTSQDSQDRTADRLAIADLMTGWIHRDLAHWDELAALFTDDAEIEITWFRGKAADFVAGSRSMTASPLRTKHLIASPVITFAGDSAVVETNAMIVGEHTELNLGTQTHNRFIDRVVKTTDGWRIARREAIYDLGGFTYPLGVELAAPVDAEKVRAHPSEYASLAYLLVEAGFPVTGTFPTRGSDAERRIKDDAIAWLNGENA